MSRPRLSRKFLATILLLSCWLLNGSSFAADKEKLQAVDFAANRKLATSVDLGQYRIVHFATWPPGNSGTLLAAMSPENLCVIK